MKKKMKMRFNRSANELNKYYLLTITLLIGYCVINYI